MAQIERQQMVLNILQNLRDLGGLKQLFWEELNYERENKPLSVRGWPDSARSALADDPVLFASGGEDHAFHVVYCRLASNTLQRNLERPVVNQLIREHPYCLFVFSDTSQSSWHFLNVRYGERAEKRRLFRRMTVRADSGLRTAAERLQMMDLALIGKELFGIPALEIQKRHDDAFDVESVTKAFYKELANWYFWALKHVRFPKDAPKEADGHDHIGVIRMITRLIFCWFVKEKKLIPEELFDQRRLDELLDGFAPDKDAGKDSVFYKAILQNLFFATLNTEMDKRGWARDEQNFMAHSLYRHRDLFKKPGEALALFKNIPFLNGGLFECLDKDLGETARPRYVRIDGFSRRPDSQPVVPDFLFFGPEREEDLSADYGDRKFRKVRVRGLIHTLHRYHFTIEENTPIEQEVALDPELSGKVFENLLAAYNPETGATARKQTGSFYTPREIVDYMVDEALIAFLKGGLPAEDEKVTEEKLRRLASWEESGHDFDARETGALIAAIDRLKTLDPAVGSGAFPMGILHKLVFILGKLDPRNEQWEQRQIQRVRDAVATAEKIEDAAIRERTVRELEQQIIGIEEAFERNELDYGRKLYLIENCLYGVDIQSIAVQIAKMRFFISLIVDQRVDPDATNLGVRPLPNLETKFVAANTLIGIEKPKQALLRNPQIEDKEAELHRVREKHFIARSLSSKAKCREQDKKLRGEIAELLKNDGWGDTTAKQLAAWDPYDQNASAPFFDPEWMFGVQDGFDVVIGNPPYVLLQAANRDDMLNRYFREHFAVASYKLDLYHLFIEQGVKLLRQDGTISYITPSNFVSNNYTVALRRFLLGEAQLAKLVFFDEGVFDASVHNLVLVAHKKHSANASMRFCKASMVGSSLDVEENATVKQEDLIDDLCLLVPRGITGADSIVRKMTEVGEKLGSFALVNFGMQLRDRNVYPKDVVEAPSSKAAPTKHHRECYSGKDIHRYSVTFSGRYCYFNRVAKRGGCWDEAIHSARGKILVRQIGDYPEGGLDTRGFAVLNTAFMILPHIEAFDVKFVLGVLNSSSIRFYWLQKFRDDRRTFPKIKGEYLKLLPIPKINAAKQATIVHLVTCILATKAPDPAADTSALEQEIDRIVYELYGLTEEEIAIVERSE